MPTVQLLPGAATLPTSNPASRTMVYGTNFSYLSLQFDPTTQQTAYFDVDFSQYSSGNPTVDVFWNASATTGGVRFEVALATAAAAGAASWDTKAYATAQGANTTVSSTAGDLNKTTITITNLDSLSSSRKVSMRLQRAPADASDTMSVNAVVNELRVNHT